MEEYVQFSNKKISETTLNNINYRYLPQKVKLNDTKVFLYKAKKELSKENLILLNLYNKTDENSIVRKYIDEYYTNKVQDNFIKDAIEAKITIIDVSSSHQDMINDVDLKNSIKAIF